MRHQSTATFWSSSAKGESTRILLVRHGRVAWNAKAVFTGWTDVPLDQQGEYEAGRVSDRLKDLPITAVYSSDLIRARQTAEYIAKLHSLPVKTEQMLREINYGEWEGLGVTEIGQAYGEDILRAWLADPEHVRIPGGESFGELRDRAVEAISRIVAVHPGQTVVVVAHRSLNRVLLCNFLGIKAGCYKKLEQDNGALNSIVINGNRTTVETVNDVCHIAQS